MSDEKKIANLAETVLRWCRDSRGSSSTTSPEEIWPYGASAELRVAAAAFLLGDGYAQLSCVAEREDAVRAVWWLLEGPFEDAGRTLRFLVGMRRKGEA